VLVLHAIWESDTGGRLHLWAESSRRLAAAPKRQGHYPPQSRQHPFALAPSELKEAITSLGGSLSGESLASQQVTILLPATQKRPLPSPWLIPQDEPSDGKAIRLTPWDVDTLALDPAVALDFLLSLPHQPPQGVAFSSSLGFWTEVAKFSLELIARQCFVPTLKEDKQNGTTLFRAAWEVALGEQDTQRMRWLSKAMPPCCRAHILPQGEQRTRPSEVILSFVNRSADAFIRTNLASIALSPRGRPKDVPLAEQWLRALSSADPRLKAQGEGLVAFANHIRCWLDRIKPSEAPFRTCFRLESPDKDQEWRVSFHLQANDDRSLVVPAEEVWKARKGMLTFLQRNFENPQERLLADLGKASRLFPVIDQSLEAAHPVGVKLDTNQAYTFLRQYASLLEQSGFGILVPPWWQKPPGRISVKLKVRPKAEAKVAGSGLLGVDSILNYNWEIAIGEETLSVEEFDRLASLKVPLVQIRGQWVELIPGEIEKAIAFFQKKQGDGEMRLAEALRLGLGQEYSEVGLPVAGIDGEGWVGDILNELGGGIKLAQVKPPQTFNGKLRPYQVNGLSWLSFLKRFGLGACLADDMGLGKTIEFIAFMLHERVGRGKKSPPGPTLLICPMSVVGNWHRETQRFAPSLKVMIHHGAERLCGENFRKEVKKHDLVISTYTLAQHDEKLFSSIHWECVALDEAQSIKNSAAKQTQAIRRLNAKCRVALTGTPVENRLAELWSIMEFLNPSYLRSAKEFHTNFAIPIEKYHNPERAETLKRLIQPFVLRRLKTDPNIINDLPEKMEMKVFCQLTREQASLYEAVLKEMVEKIENSAGIERKGLVLATLTKLKQVCNHPAQFLQDGSMLPGRSGKLTRLVEMLEEILAEDDRALIFTQFAEMGVMLRHHLQETLGSEVLFLHGGTTKKQRDSMVRRFQDGGPPLFILSLKAGGLGLNLTAANHVFHFDRWWNPAVENQATDRAFRIGQKKNVLVYKFSCLGTLEERIDQMIEQKKELAHSIVSSGETWLTEMSTDELKKIFTLSREAIGED